MPQFVRTAQKHPYLRDGLALFYVAGEKGNSKAAKKAYEAAYMVENNEADASGFKYSSDKNKNGFLPAKQEKNNSNYNADSRIYEPKDMNTFANKEK